MTAPPCIASSSANGALSLGPITDEGKARSAQNALVRGLTAATAVLSMSSRQKFDALADRYFNLFQPAEPVQENSVEELDVSKWRVRRTWNPPSSTPEWICNRPSRVGCRFPTSAPRLKIPQNCKHAPGPK